MSLIVDASVVIAWVVPDEIHAGADDAMKQAQENGAVVPGLWFLEVANILVMSERKNRLSGNETTEIMEDLKCLPLSVDTETATHAFGVTAVLARRHRLSVYDASYLELALRRKLPLATLDGDLAKAAKAEGVEVLA